MASNHDSPAENALYDADSDDPLAFDDVADQIQPALSRLALDTRTHRFTLLDGFSDREDVLRWFVSATGATLGRLPDAVYQAIHRDFVTDVRSEVPPPLLGGLLDRDDAVPNGTARDLRERFAAQAYSPAAANAMRALREDAQETAPSRDGTNVDPEREPHVAMRPSLSQIEEHQRRAITALLSGFQDVDALLQWGDVLSLATHGCIPDDYIADMATSPIARGILLVGDDHPSAAKYRPAREVTAAWLLQHFADGTRERYRHAAEVSHPERSDSDSPDWS